MTLYKTSAIPQANTLAEPALPPIMGESVLKQVPKLNALLLLAGLTDTRTAYSSESSTFLRTFSQLEQVLPGFSSNLAEDELLQNTEAHLEFVCKERPPIALSEVSITTHPPQIIGNCSLYNLATPLYDTSVTHNILRGGSVDHAVYALPTYIEKNGERLGTKTYILIYNYGKGLKNHARDTKTGEIYPFVIEVNNATELKELYRNFIGSKGQSFEVFRTKFYTPENIAKQEARLNTILEFSKKTEAGPTLMQQATEACVQHLGLTQVDASDRSKVKQITEALTQPKELERRISDCLEELARYIETPGQQNFTDDKEALMFLASLKPGQLNQLSTPANADAIKQWSIEQLYSHSQVNHTIAYQFIIKNKISFTLDIKRIIESGHSKLFTRAIEIALLDKTDEVLPIIINCYQQLPQELVDIINIHIQKGFIPKTALWNSIHTQFEVFLELPKTLQMSLLSGIEDYSGHLISGNTELHTSYFSHLRKCLEHPNPKVKEWGQARLKKLCGKLRHHDKVGQLLSTLLDHPILEIRSWARTQAAALTQNAYTSIQNSAKDILLQTASTPSTDPETQLWALQTILKLPGEENRKITLLRALIPQMQANPALRAAILGSPMLEDIAILALNTEETTLATQALTLLQSLATTPESSSKVWAALTSGPRNTAFGLTCNAVQAGLQIPSPYARTLLQTIKHLRALYPPLRFAIHQNPDLLALKELVRATQARGIDRETKQAGAGLQLGLWERLFGKLSKNKVVPINPPTPIPTPSTAVRVIAWGAAEA